MDTKQAQPSSAETNVIATALTTAASVTLLLAEGGVGVLAAMANGRRPLLMVDHMPKGLATVVKRSHPNGYGGTTLVEAAVFHGCQLEWMHDVLTAQPVGVVGHA